MLTVSYGSQFSLPPGVRSRANIYHENCFAKDRRLVKTSCVSIEAGNTSLRSKEMVALSPLNGPCLTHQWGKAHAVFSSSAHQPASEAAAGPFYCYVHLSWVTDSDDS